MDFGNAVEQIVSRVKELGIGIRFSYEDVNRWLRISSGEDLMWIYDRLSDRLTIEHSIYLELEEDYIITSEPDESDIKAAEIRNDEKNRF